jgi:hypothetical protein
MIQLIKDMIFGWRYKRAVKKALRAQRLTGRKQFVVMYNGKPVVVSKRRIRYLVSTHAFMKGLTVQDIEEKALFVTH